MPQALGRLCLILHGHLPYVLHHGVWPHGEAWLYEAAAETYLPLLELLDELAGRDIKNSLTIGLTPVLLEQLASDYFKTGFIQYLAERVERARNDRNEFEQKGDSNLATLAQRWERWYAGQAEHFQRIKRDIPGAFAQHYRDGRIEILTSPATHPYMPLLLTEASLRAQLSAGIAVSEKHLGRRPSGLWLPECAYRPASNHWQAPVGQHTAQLRPGLETHFAAAGLTHFFVDTHLIAQGRPLAVIEKNEIHPTNDGLVYWDSRRGWGSPLEPVGVASEPKMPEVFAFARHPRVSEQVWSGAIGYPGAAEYLEFHRKHGDHGLRYHRVTNHHTPLHEKSPYDPQLIPGKVYENAHHFCNVVREVLAEHTRQTGRIGTIVAPFDAELFGHWWFEGPQFLRDILMTLAHDESVELTIPSRALHESPADKMVQLPEGSWGEGGHHQVWLNDKTRWLWETEYRAEQRFAQLLRNMPRQQNAELQQVLQNVARELLLLQASDWPFVIHSGGAVDYGITRFASHANRFDRLATIAQNLNEGRAMDAVEQTELAEANAHDIVFNEIDLAWWR